MINNVLPPTAGICYCWQRVCAGHHSWLLFANSTTKRFENATAHTGGRCCQLWSLGERLCGFEKKLVCSCLKGFRGSTKLSHLIGWWVSGVIELLELSYWSDKSLECAGFSAWKSFGFWQVFGVVKLLELSCWSDESLEFKSFVSLTGKLNLIQDRV